MAMVDSASDEGQAIALSMTSARREAKGLDHYPGPVPASLEDAYRIQDRAIGLWPDRIAGWKLGRIPPPLDAQYGAGRLAGPIFSRAIWSAGPEPISFAVIDGGFAAVEAEYIFEIGEAASGQRDWSRDDVAHLVSRTMIGVEIAGSPFSGINDHGPAVTISDFGNNAGLILGNEVADWRQRLDSLTCAVSIDGQSVGVGGAHLIPNGPLDSLVVLLGILGRRNLDLEVGQLISTGAATGVHRIHIGQSARADFGADGLIDCRAIKAEKAAS